MKKSERVIFVDRDGVINKDPGGWTQHSYVTDWKDFHFLPGSIDALKLLQQNGIDVIIISNQGGVSKGYFTKEELALLTSKMCDEIAKKGGRIDDVFYCIHKTEDNCNCKKPKSGLLEMAAKKHRIKLHGTYFIGDSKVDIMAGKAVGCRNIFVLSGKTTLDETKKWDVKPDLIFKDLLEAVKWILAKEKRKAQRAYRRDKEEG